MPLGRLRRALAALVESPSRRRDARKQPGHFVPPAERVVIVTGGGTGIGRACAMRFAHAGYRVLIGGRNTETGEAAGRSIRDAGGDAVFSAGDVAKKSDCESWANHALEKWGRIDALVANAAVRTYASLQSATEADWNEVVTVNLKGVAHACAAVLPAMIRQRSGAIVIVSSTHALVGRADMPLYDATKAAVLSLARSLAVAHGRDGIRVNAVCPGYTITEFHEASAAGGGISPEQLRTDAGGYGLLGRAAEPDEIAAPIFFLASDGAANITGQSLMVDGGVSIVGR